MGSFSPDYKKMLDSVEYFLVKKQTTEKKACSML